MAKKRTRNSIKPKNSIDPAKLAKVVIDRSDAVSRVLKEEPEFTDAQSAWEYAAKNNTPAADVATMYDVLQDMGRIVQRLFSDGRKAEYRQGIAQVFYKHMPRIGKLPAYLPKDPSGGVPVAADSKDGTQAAQNYIRKNNGVTATIFRMFQHLHRNGKDIRAEADLLIALILQMVEDICNTPKDKQKPSRA